MKKSPSSSPEFPAAAQTAVKVLLSAMQLLFMLKRFPLQQRPLRRPRQFLFSSTELSNQMAEVGKLKDLALSEKAVSTQLPAPQCETPLL
jgi:hypothetical protein